MKIATIVLIAAGFSLSGCKKKSKDLPPTEESLPADPDDGIIDPEFPAGLIFSGSTGCVSSVLKKDDPFPGKLSDTGCFSNLQTREPIGGALNYTVRNAFFSGAAKKERYLLLPPAAKIKTNMTTTWTFPVGTIALKTFTIDGLAHETRILKKTAEGLRGATYKWNLDGIDAEKIETTTWESVAGMDWVFPAETDCVQCHTPAAGDFLGWETRQLNTRSDMFNTGHRFNQVYTLDRLELLEPSDIPIPPADYRYPILDGINGGSDTQARTWLHLNCAYCHMPESSGNAEIDLRFDTPLADMNSCNADDLQGDQGVPDSKIIVPEKPELSNVYLRMINPDISATMPLYSTMPTDPLGTRLVKEWIMSIKTCPGEGDSDGPQEK